MSAHCTRCSVYTLCAQHCARHESLLFSIGYHIFCSMFYWCWFLFSSSSPPSPVHSVLISFCSTFALIYNSIFNVHHSVAATLLNGMYGGAYTHTQRKRIQANLHRFSKQMWDSENINTNESLLVLACQILGLNIIVEKCRVADVCLVVFVGGAPGYTHTQRHWHTKANNPNQTLRLRNANRTKRNSIIYFA